ncbi:MAG: uracil-DNA glycosylase [Bacteroidales bacterium]|nr:uracil-DNA glycosylase [Bacteroidales bacterium]
MEVKIEDSWKEVLKEEFDKPYFQEIVRFLHQEKEAGKTIYPRGSHIFKAFEMTPFPKVRVAILGQDPYHGPSQAMGLSFSVPDHIAAPPSLKNIFKEIENDLGVKMQGGHSLEKWASQGVLMLNAILSVEAGKAASHSHIGWQHFTDAVISHLSSQREGIIFLLWGNFARSKKDLIDARRHHILEAAHPSPLARGAFFGCKHFSQTNHLLRERGEKEIDWIV